MTLMVTVMCNAMVSVLEDTLQMVASAISNDRVRPHQCISWNVVLHCSTVSTNPVHTRTTVACSVHYTMYCLVINRKRMQYVMILARPVILR